VATPEPNGVPTEPPMTKPLDARSSSSAGNRGKNLLGSLLDGADVYVTESLVGPSLATLRLSEGMHTVKITQ